MATHLKAPPFIAVGGGEAVTLDVAVPRTLRRLANTEAGERPKVEMDDLENFQKVDLHIAYRDTPFYYRPKAENIGAQLRNWAKGLVAIAHTARDVQWQRPSPTAER